MVRSGSCGTETSPPFTCQYYGRKFFPECRLPPHHQYTGRTSWQKKPTRGVGMPLPGQWSYICKRQLMQNCGLYRRANPERKYPVLKIMRAIITIVLIVFLFLVLKMSLL